MPKDSTPLSLPFFMLIPSSGRGPPSWPPATLPPSSTTGTMSPSLTLGAPVTIWIVSEPTSTWHTISLSASGCFSIFSILPTTIFSRFLSSLVKPSTFVPVRVILSKYSWSVHSSSGTYAFIHDNAEFIFPPSATSVRPGL